MMIRLTVDNQIMNECPLLHAPLDSSRMQRKSAIRPARREQHENSVQIADAASTFEAYRHEWIVWRPSALARFKESAGPPLETLGSLRVGRVQQVGLINYLTATFRSAQRFFQMLLPMKRLTDGRSARCFAHHDAPAICQ